MRFYESEINTQDQGSVYVLSNENSHHFSRVLRGKVGNTVYLCNGRKEEYVAEVVAIDKKKVQVRVKTCRQESRGPEIPLILVVALCNKQKMAWIVEKAVELGVSEIHPVLTERTQHHKSNQFEAAIKSRYEKIIISAAMQSGLTQLPKLMMPRVISDLPWDHWARAQCYVCHPQGGQADFSQRDWRRVLMIGPEGGWSDQEVDYLVRRGGIKLRLAKTVLRMETAVIVALTQAYE